MSQAEDILAIQSVLARYAIALDSRAPDLLIGCFTGDAELSLGGVAVTTVLEYRDMCATVLPEFDATLHHLGLPAITVTGNSARSRCSFVAYHLKMALAPEPSLVIGGWYDDSWVRTVDGWRISRRVGNPLWSSGNAAVIPGMPLGAFPRSADHDAPAWLS